MLRTGIKESKDYDSDSEESLTAEAGVMHSFASSVESSLEKVETAFKAYHKEFAKLENEEQKIIFLSILSNMIGPDKMMETITATKSVLRAYKTLQDLLDEDAVKKLTELMERTERVEKMVKEYATELMVMSVRVTAEEANKPKPIISNRSDSPFLFRVIPASFAIRIPDPYSDLSTEDESDYSSDEESKKTI